MNVARDREVDQQQRAPVAGLHDLGERLAVDDRVRRARRGDDDVGGDHLLGELVEAHGAAVEAVGEADRAVVVAVGDEDRLDALGGERAGGQLRGLAGADDEHAAVLEVADRPLRELDRDRGDRHRPLRDPGLRAGALAGPERGAEDPVEDRAGRALDQGELVGALDLALDLGLADDHRVESGGDPEEVLGGLGAAQRVEVADEVGRLRLGLAREQPERRRLGADRVGGVDVDLGPVAGRDRGRLGDLVALDELVEDADGAALGEREALAELERSGLVRDAEGQQLSHCERPPRPGPRSSPAGGSGRWSRFSASSASSPSSRSTRCQSHRHDRDVDQQQGDEDDVGAGDVLAGLVERQRRGGGEQRAHEPASPRGGDRRDPRAAGGDVVALERAPQPADLRPRRLRRELEADQRLPQQRHPGEADEERDPHLRGHAAVGGGEDPRVDERLGEPDGDEVERHERVNRRQPLHARHTPQSRLEHNPLQQPHLRTDEGAVQSHVEFGKKTKSTPMGVIDYPVTPLSLAIASEATFVARAIDINVKHLSRWSRPRRSTRASAS